MANDFSIFVVDDDPLIQDTLRAILEGTYGLEIFGSAEVCRARMAESRPDCLLLDIGLPGINGYDFCRQLKDDPATRDIPITFISGYDTIDYRLKGYDAGGEDFIVKPFEPEEVLRKVNVARQMVEGKRQLQAQAQASEELSSLALASMGESGIVLQYMSKLIACRNEAEIARGMLELLRQLGVEGAVQAAVGARRYTISLAGENLPLEISVLDHVRGLERIFEFHNRAVYNFERIAIMVSNMPIDDAILCGRIRDNLATAAQGADARLESIEIEESNHSKGAALLHALSAIEATLDQLTQAQQNSRYQSSQLIYQLEEDLARAFVGLGLSDAQERRIEDLVKGFVQKLGEQMDQSYHLQDALQALSAELHRLHG